MCYIPSCVARPNPEVSGRTNSDTRLEVARHGGRRSIACPGITMQGQIGEFFRSLSSIVKVLRIVGAHQGTVPLPHQKLYSISYNHSTLRTRVSGLSHVAYLVPVAPDTTHLNIAHIFVNEQACTHRNVWDQEYGRLCRIR